MLGSCVADLSEVGSCYREADCLWHLARDQHSENDVSANEALEELQLLLHELHVAFVREAQEEDADPDAVDEDEAMPDTIRNVAEAETKMYGEDALSEVEKLILDPDYVEQEGSPVFEGAPQAPTPHDEQMLEVDVSEGSAEEKTAPAAPHKERGPEKAEVDAPGEQGVVAEKQLKLYPDCDIEEPEDDDEVIPDTNRGIVEAEALIHGEDALPEVEKDILGVNYEDNEKAPVF